MLFYVIPAQAGTHSKIDSKFSDTHINLREIYQWVPACAGMTVIFLILLTCSFILIPYSDSFYYWDWGKHLAWGYYDGPPLIAFSMRIFQYILGDHTFAINLLGVTSIALTTCYVYRTARILFNKIIARNAALLWLFSTPVLHYLFLWVTYDNLLNLFWAATIFFTIRYIEFKRTRDLYFASLTIGFMLLSKYTGLILVTALILFISIFYRQLLKNKHFYFAILVTLSILMPHLYWCYQHQWVSFYYLFSQHTHYDGLHFKNIGYFFIKILKTYDILFALPFYVIVIHALFLVVPAKAGVYPKGVPAFARMKRKQPKLGILLLHTISWTFLISLFLLSFKNSISKHWLTPFTISSAILGSFYFSQFRLHKSFNVTLICYFIWGLYYLTVNCIFQRYFDEDFFKYRLIQKAGKTYTDEIIVTSNWETAAKLSFWLPKPREVYTLPCGKENQYAEWSKDLNKTNILYLDFHNQAACIRRYFPTCDKLPSLKKSGHRIGYIDRAPTLELSIYRCKVD